MTKKMLKDLQVGNLVQMFKGGQPLSYPHQVTLIELFPDDKKISALHLTDPSGNKEMYSFLDKEQTTAMYDRYGNKNESVCSCRGSVIE